MRDSKSYQFFTLFSLQHVSIKLFVFQLRSDQDEVRNLTSGNWEVTKIVAYDENNQTV